MNGNFSGETILMWNDMIRLLCFVFTHKVKSP